MNFQDILKQVIYPEPVIIVILMLLVVIDLLTGIRKANSKKEATTSRGLRQTIDKATQYFSFIISMMLISNVGNYAEESKRFTDIFIYSLNGLAAYMCYIELKSILENIIEINPSGDFANMVKPIHNVLILKFGKNDNNNAINSSNQER